MPETISLTRALTEVKVLDDRIKKAVGASTFIAIGFGTSKRTASGQSNADVVKKIQADADSVSSLIDRRAKIKNAIQRANVATEVTIGDKTMTIAQAITIKKSHEEYLSLYLNQAMTHMNHANNQFAQAAKALNARVDQVIAGRSDKDDVANVANLVKSTDEPHLINPLQLEDFILKLKKVKEDFELEVDFALSEVNAKTLIEIA